MPTSMLLMNDGDGNECRSVMAALEHGLSSMATGPSGVGKIETFKEITRAVGKKSIVFNCSIGLDYSVLAKFFKVHKTHSIYFISIYSTSNDFCIPLKGLIQTGAWVIFYDFDCIEANVLSVVAQQILMLHAAKANRLIKIMFDDTPLKLDISCNIFATINTDFACKFSVGPSPLISDRTTFLLSCFPLKSATHRITQKFATDVSAVRNAFSGLDGHLSIDSIFKRFRRFAYVGAEAH